MAEKTKILIVDDEPVNLDFFELMLGKLGFEVYTAEDGEEALEMIGQSKPDLVILDNVMPKLSGWQVTRLLKTDETYAEFRDIPIIMFSAMDDVKDKVEGFELGIEDYITKPFNFSEVLARIRAVLRSNRMYLQIKQKRQAIELADRLTEQIGLFLDELKKPLDHMHSMTEGASVEDSGSSAALVEYVRKESSRMLESAEKLEQQIGQLKGEEILADDDVALRELDSKLREHFVHLEENEESMKEVKE